MRFKHKNRYEWARVPFAWVPFTQEGVTYWLEFPPYERRVLYSYVHGGAKWEYRAKDVPWTVDSRGRVRTKIRE